MIKLLGSNLALFLGLSLVLFVEMDDHSQTHDWRYYALAAGFALSALALVVEVYKMARARR